MQTISSQTRVHIAGALLSAVAAKVLASSLGTVGFSHWQTLVQVRNLALGAATMNGQAALIQGASSPNKEERAELCGAAATLMALGIMLVGIGGVMFHVNPGTLIAAALLVAFTYWSSILTARQVRGRLIAAQVAGPLTMAVLAWPLRNSPAVLLVLSATVAAVASYTRVSLRFTFKTLKSFATGAVALTLASIAGSWTLLAVRARIGESNELGLFDAAWGISAAVTSILIAASQTVLLPRWASGEIALAAALPVLGVTAIVACAVGLLRNELIPVLYSHDYAGAAHILRYTLPGDFLKVVSWTLSLPFIAAKQWSRFLLCELAAWLTFYVTPLLAPGSSIERAAMGYLAAYAIHALACAALLVWRKP